MFKNNIKLAWRNVSKNKFSSLINISGLAVGMAVAIVACLWVWDEVAFDHDNLNYQRVAQVMQNQRQNGETVTWAGLPYPLAESLRSHYAGDFDYVVLASSSKGVLAAGEKKIVETGSYMEPKAPWLLDLKMKSGRVQDLEGPDRILLSVSTAKAIFGDNEAMDKIISLEGTPVRISGVFEDLPANSSFAELHFLAPWQLRLNTAKWITTMDNPWGNNGFNIFVKINDHADFTKVTDKIKDAKLVNIRLQEKLANPKLFLQPMARWHLYSEFRNGINAGGRIQYVWMVGAIGAFVLLLACINFMNLSTARSEKRAKEVGIRKTIGSLRYQLIYQFLAESILLAFAAFLIAISLVEISLPGFDVLAGKNIVLPWHSLNAWVLATGFILSTGIIAGSYPAFYLSSFRPMRVLKGSIHSGRFSSVPRKVLVVFQFSVSLILIIGTIIVFRQIIYAKNRPAGYNRNGLLSIELHGTGVHSHFAAIADELKKSGSVSEMAESGNPITAVWSSNGGMSWKGKAAGSSNDFPMSAVSFDYGKTVGWQISKGRDFSPSFPSDSAAFIINESAAKFMGFKNPVGEQISFNDGVAYTVVGVVRDFIIESPYEPVRPSLFRLSGNNHWGIANIKLNPNKSIQTSLSEISSVFNRYSPEQPFTYKFVDDEYARKFSDDEKLGRLAGLFASLAIFISCLGLFGLASFVAEQRTKEIGVRKILGATILNTWKLLSRDFIMLIVIAVAISIPLSVWSMNIWLQHYSYRTTMAWWIFTGAAGGTIAITLLTVSYHTIRAAMANPVKSLRTE